MVHISLTLDDGWRSQFVNASPILNKYGIKATFYIVSEYLQYETGSYMSVSQVCELYGQGHEIGAHSVNHANLHLTFLWNGEQVLRSMVDLRAYGFEIRSFCYPYGKHNWVLRNLVLKAGYDNARCGKPGCNKLSLNKFAIKGRSVKNDTRIEEIEAWIKEANNGLLVLIFHQIESSPGEWGCTEELFEEICKIVKRTSMTQLSLTDTLNFFLVQ